MIDFLKRMQDLLNKTRKVEGIAPLAFRLFLAPVFILAGLGKLTGIENTASYFAFLGLPAPTLMAYLAGLAEFVGGILLVPGIAVRWVAVPLMITMAVAAGTAHWDKGWHALPETTLTVPWEWREDLIEGAVRQRGVIVQPQQESSDPEPYVRRTRVVTLTEDLSSTPAADSNPS